MPAEAHLSDTPHLHTYLNDHLAGSVVGTELAGFIKRSHPDVAAISAIYQEIVEDRQSLESLMKHLRVSQSPARKASAWMSEKMVQLKLRYDDKTAGAFHLMEATEALSLGIEGKHSLWIALKVASIPEVNAHVDLDRLIGRAADQRMRVEAIRQDAARSALR